MKPGLKSDFLQKGFTHDSHNGLIMEKIIYIFIQTTYSSKISFFANSCLNHHDYHEWMENTENKTDEKIIKVVAIQNLYFSYSKKTPALCREIPISVLTHLI